MSEVVLGLDVAHTKIGWARGQSQSPKLKFGVFLLADESVRGPAAHLAQVDRWLREVMFDQYGVAHVVVEKPYLGHDASVLAKISEVVGVVRCVCAQRGALCDLVTSGAWRKMLFGVGQAPKELKKAAERRKWLKQQAIDACRARGWDVENDDEADACGLANLALSKLDAHWNSQNAANLELWKASAP